MLFGIGVEDNLNNTLAISHVEKDNPAMISAPIHPATQRDGLINQSLINQAAIVGSHRCLHDLMSGSHPALEDSLTDDDAGLVSVFVSLVPEPPPCSD